MSLSKSHLIIVIGIDTFSIDSTILGLSVFIAETNFPDIRSSASSIFESFQSLSSSKNLTIDVILCNPSITYRLLVFVSKLIQRLGIGNCFNKLSINKVCALLGQTTSLWKSGFISSCFFFTIRKMSAQERCSLKATTSCGGRIVL